METIGIVQAIILGIVQGLGEFLPISSSGHLVLLQQFFNIDGETSLFFAVMLHVGTLISVFIVYRKDICELFAELGRVIADVAKGRGLRCDLNPTRKLGFLIIVATIPTAAMGLFLNDMFTGFYDSVLAVGTGLIFTGTILFIADRMKGGKRKAMQMPFRSAVFVGIMQGIAITPGISRSGSTLFGGLTTRLDREFAVKFAFLISIPSILGSVVLEAPAAIKAGIDSSMIIPVLVGMLFSALFGYFAIKGMIRFVTDRKLIIFSIYTWILGGASVIYAVLS